MMGNQIDKFILYHFTSPKKSLDPNTALDAFTAEFFAAKTKNNTGKTQKKQISRKKERVKCFYMSKTCISQMTVSFSATRFSQTSQITTMPKLLHA